VPMSHSLRAAVAVAGTSVLLLAGCAGTQQAESDGPASSGGAYPVTIEHAFGETTIEETPENVVTWGWGSTEAALALGVVPVAMPFQAYGGDENGVLPWIAEELESLGAGTPTVLTDDGEAPPYEEIAAADPDVILASYSGITEEQYELLNEIAPTVPYEKEPWSTPWKDVIATVGTVLDKPDEAEQVVADIDSALAEGAAAHPELAGKSIAAVWDGAGTFYVYKPADPRVDFLLELGLESADSVDELAAGDSSFYYTLSYEQLDKLDSDILISYSDTAAEQEAFMASSYAQVIPAVATGAVAQVVGPEFVASVSPPTALSVTWGLDTYLELLSSAASAADAAE
jgi:iron complex transport system substrate-binding protein